MDFKLSEEDTKFRDELREFIAKEWTPKDFDAHSMNVWSYDFDNAAARDHAKIFQNS